MFNLVVIFIYGFVVCLGAVAGTCTQGDDTRFFISLLYGVPIAIFILLRLLLDEANLLQKRLVTVASLLLFIFILYFWFDLAIQTSFNGHNLCGEEFDFYTHRPYLLARLIPIIHIASAFLIFIAALRKLKTNALIA
ncbi:hypothetical protein [Gallaecimonas mangrovi]|uniref:hypothetical protein n=1 Tax=Gallaecimonas mangrovi TaxID=2291597 RepID=UPI000E2057DF|nr:hypothetical protein [Gallaecimonas mangrovi]